MDVVEGGYTEGKVWTLEPLISKTGLPKYQNSDLNEGRKRVQF